MHFYCKNLTKRIEVCVTIRITNRCDFLYYVFISFFSSFPSLHVLLNQMAAIVLCSLRLVLLYSYTFLACLALMNFRVFIPCIFCTCYNKNYQQMRLFVLCLYFLFLVFSRKEKPKNPVYVYVRMRVFYA